MAESFWVPMQAFPSENNVGKVFFKMTIWRCRRRASCYSSHSPAQNTKEKYMLKRWDLIMSGVPLLSQDGSHTARCACRRELEAAVSSVWCHHPDYHGPHCPLSAFVPLVESSAPSEEHVSGVSAFLLQGSFDAMGVLMQHRAFLQEARGYGFANH